MRAGVVVSARPGVEDLAVQAEELGLHSFWVNDTPMVHGDPFVALGLCAKATSRIKLGIGVTSPALRSAPAAASGFASLNALAPGRLLRPAGPHRLARTARRPPPRRSRHTPRPHGLAHGLLRGHGGAHTRRR
jgi:5,10-methylenetetrahydromethanopterin reductase